MIRLHDIHVQAEVEALTGCNFPIARLSWDTAV